MTPVIPDVTNPADNELAWVKSSFSSQDGNCVAVRFARDGHRPVVQIRDTKNPHGGVLTVTHSEWAAFTALARRH